MADFDVTKVKDDISDLKSKKQTLLLSIQRDIDAINGLITAQYCMIGEKAYELSVKGNDSMATLSEHFENIGQYREKLAAKNKKITEISERYDDEIDILEKLIPAEPEPMVGGTIWRCHSCGESYTVGEDLFCMKCGSKLSS